MAYDEKLAQRTREALEAKAAIEEKKAAIEEREMFGGVGFVVLGEICVGVIGAELVVRMGPEQYRDALRLPHVRPMEFTGSRPRKGMVYVEPGGVESDAALRRWVERGLASVQSMPPPKITQTERTLPREQRTARK